VGRARWLILPGILLSIALGISTAVPRFGPIEAGGGDITWRPTSITELSDSYTHGVGSVTLDLSGIDFTGHDKAIEVHLNFGDLHVILPPKVDTTVHAKVDTGDGHVFDTNWSGVSRPLYTVVDDGTDGAGGGTLNLTLKVNVGTLEVTR
jgi:predicted membrane protein